MTTLAWMSDIHFDFVSLEHARRFLAAVAAQRPDGVVISGDLGTAPILERVLDELERGLPGVPIHFVLGNHDYYGAAIATVRERAAARCARSPQLVWLDRAGVVPLTPQSAIIGHEAWSDGGYGDYPASTMLLRDFVAIEDFAGLDKGGRWELMRRLAREGVALLADNLDAALARHDHVVVVTHPPPFWEVALYQDQPGDPLAVGLFTCRAMGDLLLERARRHPRRRITVLAGHTHCAAEAFIRPNLHVLTAGARYHHPRLAGVWSLAALRGASAPLTAAGRRMAAEARGEGKGLGGEAGGVCSIGGGVDHG